MKSDIRNDKSAARIPAHVNIFEYKNVQQVAYFSTQKCSASFSTRTSLRAREN